MADYHPSPSSTDRLQSIDGLRGLAACGVAFGFHAQFLFADPQFFSGSMSFISVWFATCGWTLVDLFFVLSGYVICYVYTQKTPIQDARSVVLFVKNRIARLYPLHLFMLIITALIFRNSEYNSETAFFAHLFFAQASAHPVGHTYCGPSWSISVECICYLFFVIALWADRRFMTVLAYLTIIFCGIAIRQIPNRQSFEIWEPITRGMGGFFLGVILFNNSGKLKTIKKPFLITALVSGIALNVMGIAGMLPLTYIAWPSALLLSLDSKILRSPILTWIGDRSFAIYLVHMPIIDVAHDLTGGVPSNWLVAVAAYASLVAMTMLVANALHVALEVPAKKVLRSVNFSSIHDLGHRSAKS